MKTGIVDVGGGLRGIYGAGVFDYCMDKKITFDYCIGVSAGSANIASFLAGQRKRNFAFYFEYPFRRKYMSLHNFIRKGSYIDLDYVYGALSNENGENPLNYQGLITNPAEMKVVASEAVSGKIKYFEKTDLSQNNYGILKASSSIPVVCKPYLIEDTLYFDGALGDPVPIRRAFSDGCDKVVVILTKPRDVIRSPGKDEKLARLLRHQYPEAAKNLALRAKRYNESVLLTKKLEAQGKAVIIAPDNIEGADTLTKNKAVLHQLYQKGYRDAEKIEEFLNVQKYDSFVI
ncbi:patatin-like phospholipase family protein [Aminipila luticellarii]|uniref:Patatin family protein n=1 Tax=Aminipila luticellarii TaxID=2507160 RepID=A0A410PXP7_9FIRM|nr:patatin family protein [Aminipila luticellarii]QAT43630.1 patatin family protein [Aminipila luticellarii]